MRKQIEGLNMTNCIIIGKNSGNYLTDEDGIIMIGNNLDNDETKKIIIGDKQQLIIELGLWNLISEYLEK